MFIIIIMLGLFKFSQVQPKNARLSELGFLKKAGAQFTDIVIRFIL